MPAGEIPLLLQQMESKARSPEEAQAVGLHLSLAGAIAAPRHPHPQVKPALAVQTAAVQDGEDTPWSSEPGFPTWVGPSGPSPCHTEFFRVPRLSLLLCLYLAGGHKLRQ